MRRSWGVALILALAACSSGGEDESSPETSETTTSTTDAPAATADPAWCDAVAGIRNNVFLNFVQPGDTVLASSLHNQLAAWDTVEAGAPEDLAERAAELAEVIDKLGQGDPAAFNENRTQDLFFSIIADAMTACGIEAVEVVVTGAGCEVPDADVAAGRAGVVVQNDSDAGYEVFVDDRGAAETLLVVPSDPDTRWGGMAELPPGDYEVKCQPVASDPTALPEDAVVGELTAT